MNNDKLKILIIGSGAQASAIARKYSNEGQFFVTSDCEYEFEYFKTIDIRDDDLTELLKFVLDNKIDITIPISKRALKSDIVSFFESNGQIVFAPDKNICNILFNRISEKKFLYKIQAPTPKFGTYNKLQVFKDSLKNAQFPLIIQTAYQTSLNDDRFVCTNESSACAYFEYLQLKGNVDILAEEFVYGKSVTVYYITDGYTILPITNVNNYKFSKAETQGIFTDGVGCYAPGFSFSKNALAALNKIAYYVINHFEQKGIPYVGILGLECLLKSGEEFFVNSIKPFFQQHDARAVLNLCQENLLNVFISCVNGYFSDEYSEIKTNDYSCVSVTVSSDSEKTIIPKLDLIFDDIDFIKCKKDDDEYLSVFGENFVLTEMSATLTQARKNLKEDLDLIRFDGINYRRDIPEFQSIK